MKARTILASTVAAGAVAAGVITSSASAHPACNDTAFIRSFASSNNLVAKGIRAGKLGMHHTAAAEHLLAWQTMIKAPVSCTPILRTVRTHALRETADYWRGENAAAAGDMAAALAWMKAAINETDLVLAGIATFNGG